MTQTKLKDHLRLMVLKYGFEQVNESLKEVRPSTYHLQDLKSQARRSDKRMVSKVGKTKPRVTAPQYVSKMELPSEKAVLAIELAQKFENKSFLPTFGDIVNFCQIYGIHTPASKSRASAIPRVFKFLATMNDADLHRIIDDGLFSGPSSLGPIADAIRRNGRAAAAARPEYHIGILGNE